MKSNDPIGTLNGLIETSRDGEYDFRHVAERAQSPALRALFAHQADLCALAAADLASCVRQLGGEPDTHGSASRALHRGWATLRSSVVGTTDLALLEDCERSEDLAVERYRSALQSTDLPEPERTLVARQFEGAQSNHAQVRTLRDQERARSP